MVAVSLHTAVHLPLRLLSGEGATQGTGMSVMLLYCLKYALLATPSSYYVAYKANCITSSLHQAVVLCLHSVFFVSVGMKVVKADF